MQYVLLDAYEPHEVEVDDTLEIRGENFPPTQYVNVRFLGTVYHAGELPDKGVKIETIGFVVSHDRVRIRITELLQDLFCHSPNGLVRSSFVGKIALVFDEKGASTREGFLQQVVLDFEPPLPSRSVMGKRMKAAEGFLTSIGLHTSSESLTRAGLIVEKVDPHSPSWAQGIVPGDVLVRVDHIHVRSLTDVVVPKREIASISLSLKREGMKEEEKHVPIESYLQRDPFLGRWLISYLVVVIGLILTMGILFPLHREFDAIYVWIASRCLTLFEESKSGSQKTSKRRVNKKKVSCWLTPFLSFFSVLPRTIKRNSASSVGLGIYGFLFILMLPLVSRFLRIDINLLILMIGFVTSLMILALLLRHQITTRRSFLFLGSFFLWTIGRIIPFLLAIICVVFITGSLWGGEIMNAQRGNPWNWYVFYHPFLLFLFLLSLVSAIFQKASFLPVFPETSVETSELLPFSPLLKSPFFLIGEWVILIYFCCLMTLVFLGGWNTEKAVALPRIGISLADIEGILFFALKVEIQVGIILIMRVLFLPFMIAKWRKIVYQWLVPLSTGTCALTLLWGFLNIGNRMQTFVKMLTFSFFLFYCLCGIIRMQGAFKKEREARLSL
ncbi:PDZ domain-containing protein [Pajaroellobacter abortibovis]|nr:PDZ domain-containing protein [Pajaroellobacter abortibovis]